MTQGPYFFTFTPVLTFTLPGLPALLNRDDQARTLGSDHCPLSPVPCSHTLVVEKVWDFIVVERSQG